MICGRIFVQHEHLRAACVRAGRCDGGCPAIDSHAARFENSPQDFRGFAQTVNDDDVGSNRHETILVERGQPRCRAKENRPGRQRSRSAARSGKIIDPPAATKTNLQGPAGVQFAVANAFLIACDSRDLVRAAAFLWIRFLAAA